MLLIYKKNIFFFFNILSICYILNLDKTNGETCEYNKSFCNGRVGLRCVNKKCSCDGEKYKFQNGKCVLSNPKKYGEDCSTPDAECAEEKQICGRDQKCTCYYGYLRLDNRCRQRKDRKKIIHSSRQKMLIFFKPFFLVRYKEKCKSAPFCENRLRCIDGECRCPNNYSYVQEVYPSGEKYSVCLDVKSNKLINSLIK